MRMTPLSFSEIKNVNEFPFEIDLEKNIERTTKYKLSNNELFDIIVKGMYPELYDILDLDSETFYFDYVDIYINKDET